MLYNDFLGNKVSRLGFGLMRLPIIKSTGEINEPEALFMVDTAIKEGVNYFDTAVPYHDGKSEIFIGNALSKYPRETYFLADKFPGHQIAKEYKPAEVFELQLRKCKTDYFDYYLLHNVCEATISTYEDSRWNIMDYFISERMKGRIKHLGFSSHGTPENLKYFLDKYGRYMEFCQIQLNYMDWHLQDAEQKVKILNDYSMPIISMESIRGGKLANLDKKNSKILESLRPWESIASWALRWLIGIPEVKVILSGMSDTNQLCDNLRTFNNDRPLINSERNMLIEMADKMRKNVPCTKCGYCLKQCPQELNIPMLIEAYNDLKFSDSVTTSLNIEGLDDNKKPNNCVGCEACIRSCPQKINIPEYLSRLTDILNNNKSWKDISKEREEAIKQTNDVFKALN